MLEVLEIHFHICSWCLLPVDMDDLALFLNSPPFCTQVSLCVLPEKPVLVLHCQLSSALCEDRILIHGRRLPSERVYVISTYTSMYRSGTKPDFEKPEARVVLRNFIFL